MAIPTILEFAGYRIHCGEDVADADLLGKYWWTFSDGGQDVEVGETFDIESAAVADAYDDLRERFWEEAFAYYGLDESFEYDDQLRGEYVLEMLEGQRRERNAFAACRDLVLAYAIADDKNGGGQGVKWEHLDDAVSKARAAFTQAELDRIDADAKAANQDVPT